MKQSDFDSFRKLLSGCLSMWGDAPTAEATAIWFRCLAEYNIQTITEAFNAHMRDPSNGKFAPKPAHIIEQIRCSQQDDGRPGPEEAWARASRARGDLETVVWTHECSQAWSVALEVMKMGDEVGARMAFKEVYTRLVKEARARNEPAHWDVSLGFDKDRRMAAITEAVEAGLIPPGKYTAISHSENVIAGLLEGSASPSGIPPEIRQRLRELRESMTAVYDGPSEADLERERLAELKRQQAERVERYMRDQGGSSVAH